MATTTAQIPARADALASARTVYWVAGILMFVIGLVSAAGLAGGVFYAITEHGHKRTEGIIAAGASVLFGLFAALPYLIAQLLAHYVEYRVESDQV